MKKRSALDRPLGSRYEEARHTRPARRGEEAIAMIKAANGLARILKAESSSAPSTRSTSTGATRRATP
jgi:hypothetical protein